MKGIHRTTPSERESVITRNDRADKESKIPSAFHLQPFVFISNMGGKKLQISHISCSNVLWCSALWGSLYLTPSVLPISAHAKKRDLFGDYRSGEPASSFQSAWTPVRHSGWAVHFNLWLCAVICVCQSLRFADNQLFTQAQPSTLSNCCCLTWKVAPMPPCFTFITPLLN